MSNRGSFPLDPLNTVFSDSGGRKVFFINKTGLSIAPGSKVQFPVSVDLHSFTTYHVHYFVNASLDVDVYWKPNINSVYALEKTIAVTATVGGVGGILTGTTKSRFLSINFINSDVIPVTDILVSIYAVS